MKRQPKGAQWKMLEVVGDGGGGGGGGSKDVPRGGACKQGDCAMAVELS